METIYLDSSQVPATLKGGYQGKKFKAIEQQIAAIAERLLGALNLTKTNWRQENEG